MATFTTLDDDIIQSIAHTFDLGEVRTWHPIAAGTVNSNFAIATGRGQFFGRVNEGKRESDVAYEARLVAALADSGLPTPRPMSTTAGAGYATIHINDQDKFVSTFPWIGGRHLERDEVKAAHTEEVGSLLARIHTAVPHDRFAHDSIYGFEFLCERFDSFRNSPDPALADAITEIAAEITWLRSRRSDRAAAPHGIIHGDLFRDNVLFANNNVSALLDFEQASSGSLIYDLAVCVNAWCFTERFESALARGLFAGYQRVRPLTAADLVALPIELRAAAMRFTITRITDVYLRGATSPDKDFRRYARRLQVLRKQGPSLADSWIKG